MFDGLSALLVQRAGFEVAFLSGASLSFSRLGRPDLGLVDLSEEVPDSSAPDKSLSVHPSQRQIETALSSEVRRRAEEACRAFPRPYAPRHQLKPERQPSGDE